jgi:uncharacterized protein
MGTVTFVSRSRIGVSKRKPIIWALQTARIGDNAQVLELCSRLDGDVVVKPLDLNAFHLLPNWALGPGLLSVSKESAGLFVPPWPDLLVAVGKRTAPVARWVKMASGGHTKLVHLGRPRAPLNEFDLIITTPQYGLPARSNILEIDLPFSRPRAIQKGDLAIWQRTWQSLPRPLIGLIVGGAKFPIRMGQPEFEALGRSANDLAKKSGGSLIIMLSPRSNPKLAQSLIRQLDVPNRFYPWGPGLPNPYQSALSLADEFIVTSESASMISESVHTGKPVAVFDLPQSPFFVSWSAKSGWGAVAAEKGWLQPPRNVRKISRHLVKKNLVTMIGNKPGRQPVGLHSEDIVINKLKSMLTPSGSGDGLQLKQHHS